MAFEAKQFAAAVAVLALTTASDAMAQMPNWAPWAQGTSAAPAPRVAAKPRPAPATASAAAVKPASTSTLSYTAPTTQIVAPKSSVKYPAYLEGGARPSIGASAPPQVPFKSSYGSGSIIIDTAGRALYYVTSDSSAYRYPISVGREGFTWRGSETISRVQSWPDWRPPAEMRKRDPNLPEVMSGGLNNPLGAKALYLGSTLYRIHGTNDSRSIGYAASSGCFRMMNSHVTHLSTLAGVGTRVHVLNSLPKNVADAPAKPAKPTKVAGL